MQLPKIITPEYDLDLPVSNFKIKYRPFLVSEEKILLTAMEGFNGKNQRILLNAIKQIIKNCILTKEIKVDELSNVDVEWVFLNIRMKSVGEIVDLSIEHKCGTKNDIKVDLKSAKVIKPEDISNNIKLGDNIGVILKYPSFDESLNIIDQQKDKESNVDIIYELIAQNILSVYDGDNFAQGKEYDKSELLKWIEQWSTDSLKKALEFLENQPKIVTNVKYKCKGCGEEESMEVDGAADFFT